MDNVWLAALGVIGVVVTAGIAAIKVVYKDKQRAETGWLA